MLPSHYARFVEGSGIGKIYKEKRHSFLKSYNQHIQSECEDSTSTAVLEEIAAYADETRGQVNIRLCIALFADAAGWLLLDIG